METRDLIYKDLEKFYRIIKKRIQDDSKLFPNSERYPICFVAFLNLMTVLNEGIEKNIQKAGVQ